MNRLVYVLVAVFASFMLAESLTCNKCSVGLLGVCLNSANETCTTNTSSCYTGRATFSIANFVGFNLQGCLATASCNGTSNGTILGATWTVAKTCCTTDLCNPVTISGAPSGPLPLTAALGAALLASVWSSMAF